MRWGKRLLITTVILYGIACGLLYFGQEILLFHPVLIPQDQAFRFQEPFEEAWLEASDGGRVNGLLFPATDSKGVVYFLHGNGGNIQLAAGRKDHFLQIGFDFFLIDYRSFGKSTGELNLEGFYADAEAGYQYLLKRYPENQIRVYGQSLGSGIATNLVTKHHPRLLMLETPYTRIGDVAQETYVIFPVNAILRYPFESIETIGKVQCPVVVFHGTEDEVIPYEHGQKVAQAAAKSQFVGLEGAGHNNCTHFPKWKEKLIQVLQ